MIKNKFITTFHALGLITLAALAGLNLTACRSAAPKASESAKRYELKGKIISADKANHKVTIQHEDIKGYMDGMTMPFTLLADWVYPELKPGAQIQATLVVDQGRTWLEDPVITSVADPKLVGKSEETGVEPSAGTEVPDFTLVNQDGKKIRLSKYRGQPLLLTFIYTRCPLPDYCPLMSLNFQQIQKEAQNKPGLKDKLHLLSISVDPDYDKPKVLREYGARYVGSSAPDAFKQWEFAAGSPDQVKQVAQFFGLNYWLQENQIIHSLRTAIISPDGKVFKVYRGNEWKPEEVLQDLERLKL
jgi:protein SCO1/2